MAPLVGQPRLLTNRIRSAWFLRAVIGCTGNMHASGPGMLQFLHGLHLTSIGVSLSRPRNGRVLHGSCYRYLYLLVFGLYGNI